MSIQQILSVLVENGRPMSRGEILVSLDESINPKTLQRRLITLVEKNLIFKIGEGRGTKYAVNPEQTPASIELDNNTTLSPNLEQIFSSDSLSQLKYLDTPSYGRPQSSYQMGLIESYEPNRTFYVPNDVRQKLLNVGKRVDEVVAAGTYAKEIGQRLLIDLSYNSSRLEGNTYSKLDTKNLIERGLSVDGKVHEETVMIMNHKEAIQFLVDNAEELTLTSFTIRNIHNLLSQDLLKNPEACGNIRQVEVNIGKSSYLPLSNPHQLSEFLDLLLRKAEKIKDPVEQSFFLLIHLSYLQAFEDVNKRTARLTCNIPFIRHNLCPLSFTDVPQEAYFKALLYFYEKNELQPAIDLFEWAYLRSCEQYEVVKQSLGEIDTYRVQYRAARKEAMGVIIREEISNADIEIFLEKFCKERSIESQDKFIIMTLSELKQLHSGKIIGLGITESHFNRWKSKQDAE